MAVLATLSGPTMGTRFVVRTVVNATLERDLTRQLQAAVDRVDAQMSIWKMESSLSRFNRAPVGEWFEIEPEFASVVALGLEVGERTGGAFDMTLGRLVDLWGFGPGGRRLGLPLQQEIGEALAQSGQRYLHLRDDRAAIRREVPLELNLNGIAKGFGVDELARVMLGHGVRDFIAEIDGEMRVSGTRPDGSPWRVAIALPVAHLRAAYSSLDVGTVAVATSGDYRHFFEIGGRHYSHQIDCRTGFPVVEGLASATVFDRESCARADALASALMVMGWDGARDWCEAQRVPAVLLRRQGDEIEAQAVGPILALRGAGDTNGAPGSEVRPG